MRTSGVVTLALAAVLVWPGVARSDDLFKEIQKRLRVRTGPAQQQHRPSRPAQAATPSTRAASTAPATPAPSSAPARAPASSSAAAPTTAPAVAAVVVPEVTTVSPLDGLVSLIAPPSSGAPPADGWGALDTVPGVRWDGPAKAVEEGLERAGSVVAGGLEGGVLVRGGSERPESVTVGVSVEADGSLEVAELLSKPTQVLQLAAQCDERSGWPQEPEHLYQLTLPGKRVAFLYQAEPPPAMNGAQFAYQQEHGVQIRLSLLPTRATKGSGPCAIDRAAKPLSGSWKPPAVAKSPRSAASAVKPAR